MTPESNVSELPILTVSQLTNAIKHCLESSFPLVWVQGEISNFKQQSSGHLYFSLKDQGAQISAVMFRGNASYLKILPKDGDKVLIQGELNLFAQSGKYQINVRELRQIGLGELLVKLEELKVKIHKKGWFKAEFKKPLPKFPKKIGIVTSPTGAVIQDILNVLTRRNSGFQLILNPVRVQGEEAAKEIAQAIEQFNQYNLVDVIIVGRGGGSIEDLWAFNEEIVAEAIFKSNIPIISAVGHETDHCIADYVADVRAPTPSAAAEIVIAEKAQQLKNLEQIQKRLNDNIKTLCIKYRQKLKGVLKHPIFSSPYYLLGSSMQKLDDFKVNIDQAILSFYKNKRTLLNAKKQHVYSHKPLSKILHYQQLIDSYTCAIDKKMRDKIFEEREKIHSRILKLEHAWENILHNKQKFFNATLKRKELDYFWKNYFHRQHEKFMSTINTITAINPKNLLSKGFSILFSEKDNSVITSIHQVNNNDNVAIMMLDGKLVASVKKVIAHE